MNFKKVVALSICAAMVAGMSASTVMAADMPDQFKDLKANEAYEFPMIVKSFQATYWDAAQEGMKKAAEELGVTYTAQGPNSESDIADQVNMINTAIASNPKGLGLAAIAYAAVTPTVQPGTGAGLEMDAIGGVFVGGVAATGGYGSVIGTFVGIFVIMLLKTGLPYIGLQANWQQIITGLVLIIAVLIDIIKEKKKAAM